MRSAAPGSSGRSGPAADPGRNGIPVCFSQLHVPKVALGNTGKGCKPVDAVLFCISEIADSCSDVHDVTPFRYRDRITNLF